MAMRKQDKGGDTTRRRAGEKTTIVLEFAERIIDEAYDKSVREFFNFPPNKSFNNLSHGQAMGYVNWSEVSREIARHGLPELTGQKGMPLSVESIRHKLKRRRAYLSDWSPKII